MNNNVPHNEAELRTWYSKRKKLDNVDNEFWNYVVDPLFLVSEYLEGLLTLEEFEAKVDAIPAGRRGKTHRPKRRRPVPGTHESQVQLILTREEALCAQARSEYLGWRASLRQDVQRFRDVYLGNAVLTRDQIGELIASEAVRKLSLSVFKERGIPLVGHQSSDWSELLERFSTPWEQQFIQWHGETHWLQTFPVWPGSIGDDLRVLAAELSRSYDWHEVQAMEFILSTAVPLLLSMRASFRMVNREEHAYTRIILECDVREDAERVRQRFLGMQRRLLGRDNFPPKERTIRVFRFVVAQWQQDSSLKFPELRRRWSAAHPEEPYGSDSSFTHAYRHMEERLVWPVCVFPTDLSRSVMVADSPGEPPS